jgi:hypothetical protein
MVPGALVAGAGMALLTQINLGTSYLGLVLPAEVLLGAGTACAMVPAFSLGTLGVDRRHAGVAAATVNAAQQVGGSIGVAVLNTVAVGATIGYASDPAHALVHGYQLAAGVAALLLLLAALVAAVLVNARSPRSDQR